MKTLRKFFTKLLETNITTLYKLKKHILGNSKFLIWKVRQSFKSEPMEHLQKLHITVLAFLRCYQGIFYLLSLSEIPEKL